MIFILLSFVSMTQGLSFFNRADIFFAKNYFLLRNYSFHGDPYIKKFEKGFDSKNFRFGSNAEVIEFNQFRLTIGVGYERYKNEYLDYFSLPFFKPIHTAHPIHLREIDQSLILTSSIDRSIKLLSGEHRIGLIYSLSFTFYDTELYSDYWSPQISNNAYPSLFTENQAEYRNGEYIYPNKSTLNSLYDGFYSTDGLRNSIGIQYTWLPIWDKNYVLTQEFKHDIFLKLMIT
jgi:hypothetical protein